MSKGLRALCAQCQQPLNSATVASGCNHLFHKVCLIEGAGCGRCGATLRPTDCLSLYNLCCQEDHEDVSDIMAAAARIRASLEGLDDVDEAIFDNSFFQAQGASEVEEVALLCLMRERIGSRRVELEDERTQLCTARERLEVQQRKLRAQQSCKRKREEEALKLKKEIRSLVEQHDQISGELNQVRQRDAILEYWEALRHGKDDEALQKLIKLVGLVSHPWKMLSHVARLRDHFRKQRDHHDRDRALADQREKRAKREIAELERTLKDLKEQQHK
ncbi:unnamed protein product [Durusdinium trenchii]|uniref:RING-type domain-containing protein n=1 Tax=Durusdinium trenchii TaxID=1381693 RepID=A0ABP0PCP9_9DINO